MNPNLEEIAKALSSKKLMGLDFIKGQSRICFSADIECDPKRRRDWTLQILAVPNLREPEHEHFSFDLKEMKKIRSYLDALIKKIESLG